MNVMKRDGNYDVAPTRVGPPIGGVLPVSLSSSDSFHVAVNTWYRLMPNGGDAGKTSEKELALGALLEWFVPCDFYDWSLKILNVGYKQPPIRIESIDGNGNCKLQDKIQFYDTLPTDVEWVIYPEMLFPLAFILHSRGGGATDYLDIGWLSKDTFAVENDDVRRLESLYKGSFQAGRAIPTIQVDRIVFRFPSLTAAVTQQITWGELSLEIG